MQQSMRARKSDAVNPAAVDDEHNLTNEMMLSSLQKARDEVQQLRALSRTPPPPNSASAFNHSSSATSLSRPSSTPPLMHKPIIGASLIGSSPLVAAPVTSTESDAGSDILLAMQGMSVADGANGEFSNRQPRFPPAPIQQASPIKTHDQAIKSRPPTGYRDGDILGPSAAYAAPYHPSKHTLFLSITILILNIDFEY
jgi:hypothetical protein